MPLPELELRTSLRLAALLAFAHGAALLLVWLLPMSPPVQGLASLVLLAGAALNIRRHALRQGRAAIRALRFDDRESVQLRRGDGCWLAGRVASSSTVGPWLTVLNIDHLPRGASHVVLLGDELDAEDLRRLRVWLRWGPAASGAEDTR